MNGDRRARRRYWRFWRLLSAIKQMMMTVPNITVGTNTEIMAVLIFDTMSNENFGALLRRFSDAMARQRCAR